MNTHPKWFIPVAAVALLWNLLGCAAFLSDAMMTPEDIAKLTDAQQAMYAARPGWSVWATGVAVVCGALGCLGLILRGTWATILLVLSLAGVIVQDIALFGMVAPAADIGTVAYVLQGLVLVIAVGLVLLARKAAANRWIR